MTTPQTSTESPRPPSPEELAEKLEQEKQTKRMIVGVTIGAVLLLAFLIAAVVYLLQPTSPTDQIRDVFIIMVAFESFVIGIALVVLIVQLASLINLIQNEVRPILDATNETVNTLRGTAEFLGENVVEPVIKLNGYLASLYRMLELMGIKKK